MECPVCGKEMKDVLRRIPLSHFPGSKQITLNRKTRTKPIYYCKPCDDYFKLVMRLERCCPVQ